MAEAVMKIVIQDDSRGPMPVASPPPATAPVAGNLRPNPDLDAAFGVRPPPLPPQQVATATATEPTAPTPFTFAPPPVATAAPPPAVPFAPGPIAPTPVTTATPTAPVPVTITNPTPVGPTQAKVAGADPYDRIAAQLPNFAKPLVASLGNSSFAPARALATSAGGAAGVGGLAGAAAAAGGPVGLGIAAAEAATALGQKFTKEVGRAGQVAGQLAGNNHLGMLTTAVGAVTDTLENIPIVGTLASTAIKGMVAPALAFQQAAGAFVDRGKEIQQYSASLSAANANANVRRTEGDIKEAGALEGPLSRLTESQSKAEANLREIFLPIKEMVAEGLALVSEIGGGILEVVKAIIVPILEVLRDIGKGILKPVEYVRDLIEYLIDSLPWTSGRKKPDEGALNSLMQSIFKSIEGLPRPGEPDAPPAPNANALPPMGLAGLFDAANI